MSKDFNVSILVEKIIIHCKGPFKLREWTKNKHLWSGSQLIVQTIKITGLKKNFSRDCRTEEACWGPSVHRKVENHHLFGKMVIAWFQVHPLRASESFSLWKVTSAYLHQIAWEIMLIWSKQQSSFCYLELNPLLVAKWVYFIIIFIF